MSTRRNSRDVLQPIAHLTTLGSTHSPAHLSSNSSSPRLTRPDLLSGSALTTCALPDWIRSGTTANEIVRLYVLFMYQTSVPGFVHAKIRTTFPEVTSQAADDSPDAAVITDPKYAWGPIGCCRTHPCPHLEVTKHRVTSPAPLHELAPLAVIQQVDPVQTCVVRCLLFATPVLRDARWHPVEKLCGTKPCHYPAFPQAQVHRPLQKLLLLTPYPRGLIRLGVS